jgi:regulator of nucleoside diphosphate kinase
MENKKIYITESDMEKLQDFLLAPTTAGGRDKDHLRELAEELNRAEVVPSKNIPGDVITMNSRMCLSDLDSGEKRVYTLVFPDKADAQQNKISILAPIGTALIGFRVGDVITWKVPKGVRRLRVEEVLYQPEASGHYEL